jgi:hypothetical protein
MSISGGARYIGSTVAGVYAELGWWAAALKIRILEGAIFSRRKSILWKESWLTRQAREDSMSQTLRYKGYDGSVEYSAEDRTLHGSLVGIRDAIVYEGVDVDSLESSFRAAVDEYLAFCAAEGKAANLPLEGTSI